MIFGIGSREEEKAGEVHWEEVGKFRRERRYGRTMRLETTREGMMSALQGRELGTKGGKSWGGCRRMGARGCGGVM